MLLKTFDQDDQKRILDEYPHKPLKDQVALVTGGSSGLGEGCVRHLAGAGARVAINYFGQKERAEVIAEEINSLGGHAITVQGNVASESEVLAMYQAVISEFGALDILVANAGIQRDASFVDMTVDQWDEVMNVNCRGMFLTAREAVKQFDRQPDRGLSQARGKIICMSSVHEVIPWAHHVNYATSKGGVMLLMKSLAQEVSHRKIRVNSIAPGAIATPINRPTWETQEAYDDLMTLIPYDRIGFPEDIGRAAVWLSSDASDYVVGTSLFVDGGMTTFESFSEGG